MVQLPPIAAPDWVRTLHALDVGVVIRDRHARIVFANEKANALLGMRADDTVPRSIDELRWDIIAPDGTPLRQDDHPGPRALATGKPQRDVVVGIRRADSESRAWIRVTAVPQFDDHGTVEQVVISLRDVHSAPVAPAPLATDAAQSRGASTDPVVSSRHRLQTQRVLDAVPGIVFQYRHRSEHDSGLIFVAGRIREVLGMTVDEVHENANVLFDRLSPSQQAKLREAIARAISTRESFQHEVCFEHVDGGVRWLRLFGVPDASADGIVYTGVMIDVTAEKQMADVLRTRQRRDAMGDMAAGIAHNFNNMLAVVLPNLQMAHEQSSGVLADLVGDAERAARSAADLVRRMLALGRADATEVAAHADLVPIVQEALHICRQTFDRGIAIGTSIRVPQAMVRAQASDLQQVVLNLCLNARDAMMGVRNPTLGVSLELDGAGAVLLTVRDTGLGMSDETLRRIGEPFFTTKQPGHGTGLGLASAFRTISEAGGTWSVLSTAHGGTTFTVRLPVADVAAPAGPRAVANASAPLSGRVLIVDDEPMVRTALARQLARTGLQPVVADGAESALEQLQAGVPELRAIVLDLSMPGMSGEVALPLIKALVPTVPVIALSGYVPDDVALHQASAILTKPLGQDQLTTVLRQVLRVPEA